MDYCGGDIRLLHETITFVVVAAAVAVVAVGLGFGYLNLQKMTLK